MQMKRDMELIRQILLALEVENDELAWVDLAFEGRTTDEVSYHIRLAAEAGLIHAIDLSSDNPEWKAKCLTSKGHDFLDAARNETIWRKAVEKVGGAVGTVSVGVMGEVLKQVTLKALGIAA
jgi:hypothetical protein